MTGKSPKRGRTPRPPRAHGPLAPERIAAASIPPVDRAWIERRGRLLRVPEGWTYDPASPPEGVDWVVFPNGDLLRVGSLSGG